jgi:hypothetical protein
MGELVMICDKCNNKIIEYLTPSGHWDYLMAKQGMPPKYYCRGCEL